MPSRDDILAEARRWIGTPYRHQAGVRGVGADCLGFVRGVLEAVQGPIAQPTPAYTPAWSDTSHGDRLLAAARRWLDPVAGGTWSPGDVLLFRWQPDFPAKHMAIATGPDGMIHAYDGAAVAETAIGPWWARRVAGVFAFKGVG